jgi:hypothetical protein
MRCVPLTLRVRVHRGMQHSAHRNQRWPALISFCDCSASRSEVDSRRHQDGPSRAKSMQFTLAARPTSTTHKGGNRHSLDNRRQNNRVRTVVSSRTPGHGKKVPMTTRNVSESSVGSHRFVSRPAAQPPIFWLVRRGKGPLGYSFSGVRSPNIPQGNGHLCCGPLDGRPLDGVPLDGRHGSGHHLFNTERLGSERLGSERLGSEVAS